MLNQNLKDFLKYKKIVHDTSAVKSLAICM